MKKIISKPSVMDENEQVLYTGNHYISLPVIRTGDGAIQNMNFISLSNKALIEIEGEDSLFRPLFIKDGRELRIDDYSFMMKGNYLPEFVFILEDGTRIDCRIFTDLSEKGFLYAFESSAELEIILGCDIAKLNLLRFSRHPLSFTKTVTEDNWLGNPVIDIAAPGVALSMAFGAEDEFSWAEEDGRLSLSLRCRGANCFYTAFNSDSDGASATLIHLQRKGYSAIYEEFAGWLGEKELSPFDDESLNLILNKNLLFNYFFAAGKDFGSDLPVALTSRSPRYYVSGAFWERDSFLWSLPAIKLLNSRFHAELARNMILTHGRNAGDHAHYIDGTVLYPGFELDEAAAYFILTGDLDAAFFDERIMKTLEEVYQRIEAEYDCRTGLYRTFLLPSDDPAEYPFVTIDNVILWRGLKNYMKLLKDRGNIKTAHRLEHRINGIGAGICEHLVGNIGGKKMFLWSADGNGNFRLYNDPPGNLSTICYYGFVNYDDPVFNNTISYYYSESYKYHFAGAKIGELACDHHPGTPSGLGLCGSLMNPGMRETALSWLRCAIMDYGLLAESIDRDSGEAKTGVGFATGAGCLATALHHISGGTER